MRRLARAGQFQHVEMARDVGADIGARVAERIAHPGLRGQMHDSVQFRAIHSLIQRDLICQIKQVEAEAGSACARLFAHKGQPVVLQLHIVIGVQTVDPDHGMALRQQPPRHMRADEAGNPGNQYRHARLAPAVE
jgi:hypothetical protein